MTEQALERSADPMAAPALLFVCDHASNAIPEPYGTLGLGKDAFETHIASDIGAAWVTLALAASYRAPAVIARWSRLLIDLNRGPDDPTLIMKLSDGRVIPGNQNVDAHETAARIAQFHGPYHAAIAREIASARANGHVPILISMHSFTPAWKGVQRPWEIGILWDRDSRLAKPLIAMLRNGGFVVGDNEPYSGRLEGDTMFVHGTMNGLPHVLIEIRQDLIDRESKAHAFADRLRPLLDDAIAAMGPASVQFTRDVAANTGAKNG